MINAQTGLLRHFADTGRIRVFPRVQFCRPMPFHNPRGWMSRCNKSTRVSVCRKHSVRSEIRTVRPPGREGIERLTQVADKLLEARKAVLWFFGERHERAADDHPLGDAGNLAGLLGSGHPKPHADRQLALCLDPSH